jgi:hypothetical protein
LNGQPLQAALCPIESVQKHNSECTGFQNTATEATCNKHEKTTGLEEDFPKSKSLKLQMGP